jgi:hypothetical protein
MLKFSRLIGKLVPRDQTSARALGFLAYHLERASEPNGSRAKMKVTRTRTDKHPTRNGSFKETYYRTFDYKVVF